MILCRDFQENRSELLRIEFVDLLIGPLLAGGSIGQQKIHGPTDAAAVGGVEIPKTDANTIGKGSKIGKAAQIHCAVSERTGASEFERLASIRLNLTGDTFLPGFIRDLPRSVLFAKKEAEFDRLYVIVGTVIILGCCFGASVCALLEPGQKVIKPLLDSLLISRGP